MRHWIGVLGFASRHSRVWSQRLSRGIGRRQAWFLAVPIALAIGCGASPKRTQDMMYDIRAYNEGLRWDKLPQSAIRIPPAERDAFLDEREQLQDELRIDDFDITRLKTEGETKDRANVQIRWVWHMDREGIVKETTSKQSWKRHGSRWLMLHEVFVRGDEMPGLALADEEDSEDEPADETQEGEAPSDAASEVSGDASTDARNAVHHEVIGALQTAEKPHRIAE